MKRKLKFIVLNGIALFLLAAAIIDGNEYALNLYAFFVVAEAILFITPVFNNNSAKQIVKVGFTFNATTTYIIDLVQVMALATVGWYWLAACKMFSLAVTCGIYFNYGPKTEEKE